jgi:O-antigen ligase
MRVKRPAPSGNPMTKREIATDSPVAPRDGCQASPNTGLSQAAILVAGAVLVPLVFHPHSPEPFQFYKTWLLTLCALGVAAAGLCTNWLHRRTWAGWHEGGLMIALVLWAILSTGWATNRYLAWQELPLLAAPVALCVSARTALTTPARRTAFMLAGVLAGSVVAVAAIAEVFGLHLIFREGGKILALFGYQNLVAQFLICSLSLAIGLTLAVEEKAPRALLLLSIAAQFVALVLTMCRSAWLGLLVAWAIVAVVLVKRRTRPQRVERRVVLQVLVGVVLLITATVAGLAAWGRASPAFGAALETRFWGLFSRGASGRIPIWRSTLALCADHPFSGAGLGNFPIEYPRHCADNEEFVRYTHNDLLQYASELGLPGVLLWSAVLVLAVGRGVTSLRSLPDSLDRAQVAGFFGVIIAVAVDSLFSYDFYQPAPAAYAYMAIGAIGALSFQNASHRPLRVVRVVGCGLAVILLVVGLGYLRTSWLTKSHYDGWMVAMAAGDQSRARHHLKAGQLLAPEDPRFWYFDGVMAYESGDLDRAGTSLTAARRLSPHVWQVHHYLAMTALRDGRLDDAEAAAKRAMELRKTSRELSVTWQLIQQRRRGASPTGSPAQ